MGCRPELAHPSTSIILPRVGNVKSNISMTQVKFWG
jgi:hypothetical protein